MKISRQFGLAALACSALLATSANAAVHTLGSSYGGLTPLGGVTFDDFTSQPPPVSYTNSAGVLGISYVGGVYGVFSGQGPDPSDKSWAPLSGLGYTSISVLGDFGTEAISFDFAHTFSPTAQMSLFYQVLGVDNTVLDTGEITGLRYRAYDNFTAYYGGDLIKEVRVYGASSLGTAFNPGPQTLDSGLLDNVYSGGLQAVVSAAVPEPSSWALMLLGFAGLGTMLRYSRRTSQRVLATA